MSPTSFEPEGSSSGIWLYIQVWNSVFYMHEYKQSFRWKSAFCWFMLCDYIIIHGAKNRRLLSSQIKK